VFSVVAFIVRVKPRRALEDAANGQWTEFKEMSAVATPLQHQPHPGHSHTHGESCGHVAVPHGDHIDYVHDGHLHREHDSHADECEIGGHRQHAEHAHVHGEGCGHVAVPHDDHIDYVHDGHRHAAHEGHWDDH